MTHDLDGDAMTGANQNVVDINEYRCVVIEELYREGPDVPASWL